jgi:hypothetical protein
MGYRASSIDVCQFVETTDTIPLFKNQAVERLGEKAPLGQTKTRRLT